MATRKAVTLDSLRERRARLLDVEIQAKEREVQFADLKIEEATRNLSIEKSTPAEERILTFAAEVDNQTVAQALRTLDMWARQTPGHPITIIINSPGGGVLSGFALFDFILDLRRRGHKVTIKVIGIAASMAAVILQAADDRVMSPNSFLLIHEPTHYFEEAEFKRGQLKDAVEWNDKLENKLLGALCDRSKFTPKRLGAKWRNRDWTLDAEEAVNLGFADRIEA